MNTQEIEKTIKDLIKNIIEGEVEISLIDGYLKNPERDTLCFSVFLKDPYHFTKNEGEALIALNHLVRKIVENKKKEDEEMSEIMIDINDFQKKKMENIRAVAHMMAERARYFKSSIELDPMTSYERRIVHEFLSEEKDIKTESDGFGKGRRVIIRYIGSV